MRESSSLWLGPRCDLIVAIRWDDKLKDVAG